MTKPPEPLNMEDYIEELRGSKVVIRTFEVEVAIHDLIAKVNEIIIYLEKEKK